MFDNFMFAVNSALLQSNYIAFGAAFIWGVISVIFSPCHLASIPLIIGYIAGFTEDKKIKNAFWYSLLFVIGLFLSIAAIGIITSLLGRMLGDIGNWGKYIIGVILVFIGLHLFDLIPINIPGLHKLRTSKKGSLGAFLLGLSYGIISGPCTFGFIAPLLTMVAIQKTLMRGLILIIIFAMGHCIPILIGGCVTSFVKNITGSANLQKSGIVFKKIAGVIFIIIAVYIIIS